MLLRRKDCNQHRLKDDSLAEQLKADDSLVKHYNGNITNIFTAIHHSGTVNGKLYVMYSISYILYIYV
jgi:hypothetical protein